MELCGISDEQIEWSDEIKHFDDSPKTTWEKISLVAYKIFTIIFFPLGICHLLYNKFQEFSAKQCLLVSQVEEWKKLKIQQFFDQYWFGEITPYNQHIRDHFKPEAISLKTPDGVHVEGTFIQHAAAKEDTPTIFIFQGNGSMSIQNEVAQFADTAIEDGRVVNFLLFDYRGVKANSPLPSGVKDLIIDAESVYLYATNHFQISKENFHIYGFSLGGGVSLVWRSLHPEIEGKCVTDRSFSSSKAVVMEQLPSVLNEVTAWLCEKLGWNLESALAWLKIQAEKLCVYSEEDPIIPFDSSLFKFLFLRKAINDKQTLKLLVDGYQGANHHSLPAQIYHDQHGINAWKKICNFLFEPKKDTAKSLPPHLKHPSSGVFV